MSRRRETQWGVAQKHDELIDDYEEPERLRPRPRMTEAEEMDALAARIRDFIARIDEGEAK